MSEGQHIQDFIEGAKRFFGQSQCLEKVKEARASFGKPAAATATPATAETFFTGPVSEYDTIAKLDAYIGKIAAGKMKTEAETKEVGTVAQTIPDLCKGDIDEFQRDVCSWKRMESSGSKFDCLAHSFLNMVSPNFRKLGEKDKISIASPFRRSFMPRLPEVLKLDLKDAAIERIKKEYEFLTDTELNILARTYKMNCIVFEHSRSEKIIGSKKVSGKITMPSSVIPLDGFPQSNTFYLLSLKGNHYEAIRVKDSYTIPRETMEMIQAEFAAKFSGNAEPVCKYPGTSHKIEEGDIVVYRGELCSVQGKIYDNRDPPHCTQLKLLFLESNDEKLVQTIDVEPAKLEGGRRLLRRSTRRQAKRPEAKLRKSLRRRK